VLKPLMKKAIREVLLLDNNCVMKRNDSRIFVDVSGRIHNQRMK
jgi:hypothetical protein